MFATPIAVSLTASRRAAPIKCINTNGKHLDMYKMRYLWVVVINPTVILRTHTLRRVRTFEHIPERSTRYWTTAQKYVSPALLTIFQYICKQAPSFAICSSDYKEQDMFVIHNTNTILHTSFSQKLRHPTRHPTRVKLTFRRICYLQRTIYNASSYRCKSFRRTRITFNSVYFTLRRVIR